MTAPPISLIEQMLRRRPLINAPSHTAPRKTSNVPSARSNSRCSASARRSAPASSSYCPKPCPRPGRASIVSFIIAGIAAGLAAICYAELASAVPVSGSTYSYAYTTLGEVVAMGVAACLLLEYVVSTAAVSVGWSQYVNKLLENFLGHSLPQALSAAPWDDRGRDHQPSRRHPGGAVRAAVDPGCQRIGRREHRHGDHQTRRAGDVRRHRVHGVQRRSFRELRPIRCGRHRMRPRERSSSPTSVSMRSPPPAMRSRIRSGPCRGRSWPRC